MDCYCDYDPPDFVREAHHAARKQHGCSECGRTIQPGERYLKVTGKWDGQISVCKRCPHCDAVSNALKERLPCYCIVYHGLWLDEGMPEYISDLRRAETGDAFAVLRLIAKAEQARRESR
jgi:hypothetical protein